MTKKLNTEKENIDTNSISEQWINCPNSKLQEKVKEWAKIALIVLLTSLAQGVYRKK